MGVEEKKKKKTFLFFFPRILRFAPDGEIQIKTHGGGQASGEPQC